MNRIATSLLLVTLSGLPVAVFAVPVTLNYTGMVTLVDYGYVNYGYAVNDSITGFFEFDSDDVQDNSFPGFSLDVSVNGPITSNTGGGGFAVSDDIGYVYAEDFGDGYVYGEVVLSDGSSVRTRETLFGDPIRYRETVDYFRHSLYGFTTNVLDLGGTFLDALLVSPESMLGTISFGSFAGTYQCAPGGGLACIPEQRVTEYDYSSRVEFILTDLRVADMQTSVVPVPAAVWLFGTALIGFVGVARKRKVG